jgi:hypothetical protein
VCTELISDAHEGLIDGVESATESSHGWHAAQAVELLQKLPLVCPHRRRARR